MDVNNMIDQQLVSEIADAAARRIRGGTPFTDAARAAMRGRGIREAEWGEYFSAVATALNNRSREVQPRRAEPIKSTATRREEPQLGFGFGEGPRHKIRPPSRRHL